MEQYNEQLHKASQKVDEPVRITVEQPVVDINNPEEQPPTASFQLTKALSLTTAMEL